MGWTEQKNNRRHDLIDKDINGTITLSEYEEMEDLQEQFYIFVDKKYPLPIKEAKLTLRKMIDEHNKKN